MMILKRRMKNRWLRGIGDHIFYVIMIINKNSKGEIKKF